MSSSHADPNRRLAYRGQPLPIRPRPTHQGSQCEGGGHRGPRPGRGRAGRARQGRTRTSASAWRQGPRTGWGRGPLADSQPPSKIDPKSRQAGRLGGARAGRALPLTEAPEVAGNHRKPSLPPHAPAARLGESTRARARHPRIRLFGDSAAGGARRGATAVPWPSRGDASG